LLLRGCYGQPMRRRGRRRSLGRALHATAFTIAIVTAATACMSSERAEREREIATLRSQLEEIRKGQDRHTLELARLAGEMKALDAQSTFVIGEVKASGEDRARVKGAIEASDKTLRELQDTVDGLRKSVAPSPASPPATAPPPSSSVPDASPEQRYATAMASLTADDYTRAMVEFRELTRQFPEHALASNAQYWIGETYYRQRDFQDAMVEFRKVIDGYATSSQVPEALLKIGLCHRALKDQPRARAAWEQVAKEYPGSNAANQARSLLVTLGGAGPPMQ
jgi:tol-pal system protein YbgF